MRTIRKWNIYVSRKLQYRSIQIYRNRHLLDKRGTSSATIVNVRNFCSLTVYIFFLNTLFTFQVIRHAFCLDEAVSIGSEVNKNPIAAEELLELCADAALDGVSLVAIENTTGEEVAVAFNKLQV